MKLLDAFVREPQRCYMSLSARLYLTAGVLYVTFTGRLHNRKGGYTSLRSTACNAQVVPLLRRVFLK
jgi:hypothetical protein